jgi:hypothetical protein
MTDSIKTAIGLREKWLYTWDPDNFEHVKDCLNNAILQKEAAAQKDGNLRGSMVFDKNVPLEPWFRILETHLSELGYVVESRKTQTNGSVLMEVRF